MRILQVHNKYLHHGGEDTVVENEFNLLSRKGFKIKQVLFDNTKVSPSNIFYNKKSYLKIRDVILDFKPDVMHVHNLFYEASTSVITAAKDLGIPVVLTLHNFRLICPGGLLQRDSNVCVKCIKLAVPYHGVIHKCFQGSRSKSLLLSAMLGLHNLTNFWSKIDRIIVLTPFIKQLFLESSLNIEPSKIIVKPNSTDDCFENKINSNTSTRKDYIFVGRLSKEKGVDLLIQAFNRLPNLKLNVIGTGSLEAELKRLAKPNITFHGNQNKSFIQNNLLKSKALLFSSIWYEGLPNTILESFSAGTPVLASNIDNINGIISKNVNGDFFELKNLDSLVNKLETFERTENKNLQIGARSTFENKYTHELNFSNLRGIYQELI